MSKIQKQQESIEQLMNLIKENPNSRIVPMVETECVPSDDHNWWVCEWGKTSVEELYHDGDRTYIRSSDEEALIDQAFDDLEFLLSYDSSSCLTDKEIYAEAKEAVSRYPWEKIIAVHIQV